ncbi:MAG: beta-galactosidase, partial [Victivallales bacterium]|nr:beta-galactosidase [Victivallales bacterium]
MRFLTFICTLSLAFQLVADDAKDPFPAFDSLKPPVLMPYKAKLTVSKEGHFLINGVPRYLEGTIFYETAANNAITTPTYGYPAILNWLYESAQGYKNLQRIGFDTVGAAAPNWWIDKYRTKYIRNTIEEKEQDRYIHSGLPLYVDYTCAGWHHGALKFVQGQEPVKNAFTVPGKGNYHWLPYSATTPEGRQLWREMWTYGVEYFQKLGVKPFCYELLNEPDYNDVSEFNRSLFVERMKNKYQNDLARLNREWGTSYENFEAIGKFKVSTENIALAVEWIKFMEDAFADLCSEGAKTIRSIDKRPEVGIGFQPLSHYRTLNTNLYSANRDLNMIITGTGGGDILHSHLLRAIGDGKPIMDGETYMGKTRSSFRNKILQQYGRGYNASYIFKWSRRATDPLWSNPRPDGAKKLAQKFPYMMLNPYAVPAEALLGLMDAKKELMQVSDLFTPRDRGVAREVAVLFSYPTQRLARSAGSRVGELVVGYTEALEYAQIPIDVVLEEQLPEGRLDRYKVLVSAGTNATYPESPALLEAYVRNGGVLILGQEALQTNEYGANRPGFPGIAVGAERIGERGKFKFAGVEITAAPYKDVTLDSSWTQLAKLGDKPIVFEKSLGKGKVIYLNAKFPRDGLGDILGALLKREKINPTCLITDAETGARVDGVEAVKASRNGFVGYMLTNSRLAPRLVRFTPPEKVAFADITGQNMLETKDGGILVLLKPDDAVILLGGEASALQKRCGKLPLKTYETLKAEGKAAIEEHWARTKKDSPAFIVDRDRVAIVDLHSYANRDFVDKVPGDGKGGWTDQGAVNSLHDVEWGIRDCAGVPF